MALKWNYTLGIGELVLLTAWQLDGTQIVAVSAITIINDDRFDLNKKEVATLIVRMSVSWKMLPFSVWFRPALVTGDIIYDWKLQVRNLASQITRKAHFGM